MDFSDTPEEAAFRAEARSWLEAHAPRRKDDGDSTGVRRLRSALQGGGPEHVRRCKEWQRTLYDGGWAGITWPKEYGGRSGTPMQQLVFDQEQSQFDVSTGVFAVGIGMAGPTFIAHASPEQQERYLRPLLRGEHVWCQLFSEPGAGSDLAGLSTKAVADGDSFVVSGQKVWTSGAQHSDFGILLARTGPSAPKHQGITYFIVDMRTPGIDVRPLRQINGIAHFNEVFLTDVVIPAENVVGDLNNGWTVARTTLGNERALIGGATGALRFGDLAALAAVRGVADDPVRRQELVDAFIRFEVLRYFGYRLQTALSQGRMPGPEASVLKLAYSRHVASTGDLVMALAGAHGMLLDEDAPQDGFWQHYFMNQYGVRIGGGTDEVQRNVIGERSLGLPREPRVVT